MAVENGLALEREEQEQRQQEGRDGQRAQIGSHLLEVADAGLLQRPGGERARITCRMRNWIFLA